eukprot:TRINITY_DN8033_c0_g1_i1.p1 TRINITY_DN8033_c0_g1~~TRINITY_DN8033_c0_g1_i1.p1  ORF type:complete len:343 (-),score=65.31 TRINITY_DN8033_c0_g1_i1:4-1002(-)
MAEKKKKLTGKELKEIKEKHKILSKKIREEVKDKVKEDPNYVHPLEKEALEELKKHEIAKGLDDKFLLAFLLARKLNIDRTIELLENHFKYLNTNFPGWDEYTFDDLNKVVLNSAFQCVIPGSRDKQGNGIGYIFLNRYKVKEFPFEEYVRTFIYIFRYSIFKETLDYWRNGSIYIETLKDVSISKNIDTSKKGQALMKAIPNCFPFLMRGIYIVDAGFIVKALLKIARIFMKKKLMARVKVVNKREELLEVVDENQLITEFGGKAVYDHNAFLQQMEKDCREFIDPPIIKRKKERAAEKDKISEKEKKIETKSPEKEKKIEKEKSTRTEKE